MFRIIMLLTLSDIKLPSCTFNIVIFSLIFSVVANGTTVIKVTGKDTLKNKYLTFKARQNEPVEQITQRTGKHISQDIVNLLIIEQALHYGGMDIDYEFVSAPNVKRAMWLVKKGIALIASNSPFSVTIDESVFKSSPILARHDFVKGIYGLASNKALMKVSSLKELQGFSAVTNANWQVDIETLQALKPKSLSITPLFNSVLQQIKHRDIDFTLLKTGTEVDKLARKYGVKLARVPGVGIELIGTRHFIVSKKHPDGEKVYRALEKGLAVLHAKGLILQYYRATGNITPKKESNIKILNTIKSKHESY